MNVEVSDLKFWTLEEFKENAKRNPFMDMGIQSIFSIGSSILSARIEVDFIHNTIAFIVNDDLDWYEQSLTNEGYENIKKYAINERMKYIKDLCK